MDQLFCDNEALREEMSRMKLVHSQTVTQFGFQKSELDQKLQRVGVLIK